VIGRERLGVGHVETGACEMPRSHGLQEVLGRHDGAAGDVDQVGVLLHEPERGAIDQVPRGVVQRHAQHQEVRHSQQLLAGRERDRHLRDAGRVRRPRVDDDGQSEPVSEAREMGADRPEPRDPQDLAAELHRCRALPGRVPAHPRVASQVQDHEERVLRDRPAPGSRDVRHHHPAPGGRGEIDVVDPGPGLGDQPEPRSQGEHLLGHRVVRRQDAVRPPQVWAEVVQRGPAGDHDLVLRTGPAGTQAELLGEEEWIDDQEASHAHRSRWTG
jgi:hypothetical protein